MNTFDTNETKLNMEDDGLILLNQTIYALNKSNSKIIAIGLSPENDMKPIIKIKGSKYQQCLVLNEADLESLSKHRFSILSYFYSPGEKWEPIIERNYAIDFTWINKKKIAEIRNKKGIEVLLGYESVSELWELLPLINYKMHMLKKQRFDDYYDSIIKNNRLSVCNVFTNINNTIGQHDNENVFCMMEMMQFFPDQIIIDSENYGQNI